MIKKKLYIYNLIALSEGIFLVSLSIMLWFFAYHLTYNTSELFIAFFFDHAPSYTPKLVATFLVAILALEAIIKGTKRYGNHSYEDSWFKPDTTLTTTSSYVINRETKKVTSLAYIISQLFMAAPKLLIDGLVCLSTTLTMSHSEVLQGEAIVRSLHQGEAWQSFDEFEHLEEVIQKLIKLKLLLIRERNDCLKIRLSRDIRK